MEITELLQTQRPLYIIPAEFFESFAEQVASKVLAGQVKPTIKQAEPEKPLTQAEAVKFLGKSRQTLIAWRKKGFIKSYRISGRIYYKPSELISALKKN